MWEFNQDIWEKKYKFGDESCPEDTFKRVAKAIARSSEEEQEFFNVLIEGRFLPGGRILAYAGTGLPCGTWMNCYTTGDPEDSMESILDCLSEGTITLKAGGGIGLNFSKLRPKGSPVRKTNSKSSGPVSFMEMWNAMSKTISGVNDRKGAMIGVLDVSHPDILEFIKAKQNNSATTPVLEKFNLSVGILDEFMKAVIEDKDWTCRFQIEEREVIEKQYRAKEIMDEIVSSAWAKAEPGVVFLDTANHFYNLSYTGEKITATNPCGEITMPPYGACNLGSINLVAHIKNPFSEHAEINYDLLAETIRTAVKFLDIVIDLSPYPTEKYRATALDTRRIGLGFFGLGSALALLGIKYGSDEAKAKTEEIAKFIRDNAYRASIERTKERVPFPLYSKEFLDSPFVTNLPNDIQMDIAKHGIRNSQLLAIAPTGSISQLAGNVSSGIEPIFNVEYARLNYGEETCIEDYAWKIYKKMYPETTLENKPEFFITAHDLSWKEHIDMQAICQQYIDGAISKTINLPRDISKEELKDVFIYAWQKGLKGCTVYREGSIDGEILRKENKKQKTRPRPYQLASFTYKVKVPEQKHAFYLTFSHTKENKPIELFINTNDPTVQEWVRSLGRLVSAVFRNVEDPIFLIEEFKQIFAPSGFWSGMRQKYIPSLVAEFGEIMEDYFTEIGILQNKKLIATHSKHAYEYCKVCGQYALVYEEGCVKCLNCGLNKCE